MAGVVKFVSQSEINTKKEQKRQAREEIIRRVSMDVAFFGQELGLMAISLYLRRKKTMRRKSGDVK